MGPAMLRLTFLTLLADIVAREVRDVREVGPVSDAAVPDTIDHSEHSVLRLERATGFRLAQIADVHLEGEASNRESYLANVRAVLDGQQLPIDLAVLSGDQVTGERLLHDQADAWTMLTEELQSRSIPHTAVLGNHDAAPYLGGRVSPREYDENQDSAGAESSRVDLMMQDAAMVLSRSQLAPAALRPATSTYVVDVLLPNGSTPLLSLFHLDTGGGGMKQDVRAVQAQWFRDELLARRSTLGGEGGELGGVPPVLVFTHIPLHAYTAAWEAGACFGERRDTIRPPMDGDGDEELMNTIEEFPEVVAVCSGHDHCNDFCCASATGSTQLCYGRHSTPGGYTCVDYPLGMRIIELVVLEAPTECEVVGGCGAWRVETHVALVNGSIIHAGVLAEGGGAVGRKRRE